MTKNLDWNMALEGDEDRKATESSEVFRNYVKIVQAKDDFVLPLHVPSATNIDQRYIDAAYEEASQWEPGSRERAAFLAYAKKLQKRLDLQNEIDAPVKSAMNKKALNEEQVAAEKENKKKFDKDTNDIMGKVKETEKASKVETPIMPNLPYDRFDYQEKAKNVQDNREKDKDTYKEYDGNKKAAEEELDAIIRQAMEELDMETVEPVKETSDKTLYNTDAGKSLIEIGLTSETEKLMENGIDYVDAPVRETKKDDMAEVEDKILEEQEVSEAEKVLGLDTNIFYILRKMGK